ncbi:MAG: response regulator [candidate division Zixibacteria bacterium]|nr:response regulator [candidate division Zixibacteria bacterium]
MAANHKVLVIDDEPEITDIIKAFLSNAGYIVEVENSPVESLTKAQSFKPDVILLDIMMPVMDGYEVCSKIKNDSRLADTPVLFLTGKDAKDDSGMSFQSGGDLFIKKPFSCERLLNMVKMVLISVNK